LGGYEIGEAVEAAVASGMKRISCLEEDTSSAGCSLKEVPAGF
jgi:hypothetical protein